MENNLDLDTFNYKEMLTGKIGISLLLVLAYVLYNIYQLEKYLGFPSYLQVRKYSFEMKKYMEWLNIIKLNKKQIIETSTSANGQ